MRGDRGKNPGAKMMDISMMREGGGGRKGLMKDSKMVGIGRNRKQCNGA